MQSIKKPFNKFQQKQFEHYAQARSVDLPSLITDRYQIDFSGNGNNLDAEGHGLRLGHKESNGEQIWLANGTAKGDAVQVIQQLDKSYLNKATSKTEAIQVIEDFKISHGANNSSSTSMGAQSNSPPKAFKLTDAHRDTNGVIADYIKSRGIAWTTFNQAQEAGFADKTSAGVRFIGLDANGHPKNAETRLVEPKMVNAKLIKFICEPGSDRSYPPVLSGVNNDVHVVEGGFSALALKEIMKRQGRSPIIIVSGGKDNVSWLKHEHIQALVRGAEVTLHAENEKSQQIQLVANEAAIKQCESISNAGARKVVMQWPPSQYKDNADINLHFKQQLQLQSHLKN